MASIVWLSKGYVVCRHPCIVNFLGACLLAEDVMMVTELMQCDLYAALAEPSLQDRLSWRKHGMLLALDIARGLSCALPRYVAVHST